MTGPDLLEVAGVAVLVDVALLAAGVAVGVRVLRRKLRGSLSPAARARVTNTATAGRPATSDPFKPTPRASQAPGSS